MNIDKNGKTSEETVVAYDIQRDVISRQIIHVDFLRVNEKNEIVTIPINLNGIAPGTKKGGVLIKKMDTVFIQSLPKNMPATIEIDLTSLDVNEYIAVKDLHKIIIKYCHPHPIQSFE